MKTPNACFTRTIQGPGLGMNVNPAPAIGQGMAMPMPSTNGRASASVVPVPYRLLEKTMTWITTGATQAPARSAATPPMPNASRNEPRPEAPPARRLWKREKSIVMTSNIASVSTMKSAAMPRLNQGEALIVPKVPAVRITTRPSTPYTNAMARP